MANSMLDEIRLAQRNKVRASQGKTQPVNPQPTQDETDSVDNQVGNQTATDGGQESTAQARKLPDAPEEKPDEDVDVTVEMQPGGATTTRTVVTDVEKKDMTPPARSRKKSKKESSTTYLRAMPTALVNEARRLFPTASNNTDAVAAYISFKSGVTEDLTEGQLALVRGYKGEDPVVTVNERLSHLEKQTKGQNMVLNELELAIGFLIFDRLGYRRESANGPADVNLLENGVDTLIDSIRKYTTQYVTRENQRNGRPQRGINREK